MHCVRGVLSPLLANVLLDEVDKDLEGRGHRFVRYSDDSNVYVRSQRAGERVLQSLRRLYARLHLKINEAKTAVGTVFGRKFLGYCLRRGAGTVVKLSVAPKAQASFKERIREIACMPGGVAGEPFSRKEAAREEPEGRSEGRSRESACLSLVNEKILVSSPPLFRGWTGPQDLNECIPNIRLFSPKPIFSWERDGKLAVWPAPPSASRRNRDRIFRCRTVAKERGRTPESVSGWP